jgi:hypothetical protein
MPAKSGAQQKAAGAALSAKRGDTPKSKLKGASKSMADSMSEKQLEELASTKRKGKPERAAAQKTASKKTAAKKTTAKKTTAKKTTAKKTGSKKTAKKT